ncbi:hypothetical protein KX928_11420 [Roseobacter sp. YSTF-M11]|uniref:Uncharacterized protein n=1 Tax=Roseobacter insulae TaxID=2859783 RepID=A0A9X1FVE1_9RHOB|nr:hypothetical protein [Roseobacter insulae]MBW4708393.1 hypothetical protein [Roseobacter insulae]
MNGKPKCKLRLARLPDISPDEIIELVSDPRIAFHVPPLIIIRDSNTIAEVVTEAGHIGVAMAYSVRRSETMMFAVDSIREEDVWGDGLVLKPACFCSGPTL